MELDETLKTLRKHGVTEFSQDQFGIRVKFEPALHTTPLATDAPYENVADESSVVDAQRMNLDDVLFGAK